jgi:hypothetical protein
MAEFKYALTRVCLRSGTLTLPRKMQGVFPEEGTVEVLDTVSNEIHELDIHGPRTVTGLGPLFAHHGLDVNDGLIIRPVDDGTYAITPMPRRRQPDWRRPEVRAAFLDELAAGAQPLTEGEIRALHPSVPADMDLGSLLRADPRFRLHEGRWRPIGTTESEEEALDPGHTTDREFVGGERGSARADELQSTGGQRPRHTVAEYQKAGPNFEDAGLNSEQAPADLGAVKRARSVLEHVGFRVEGLGHGQLMAYADLGRRTYRVLVHTLPDGARLDWASLLARRRDSGAQYLAVFGDHRDLVRLHAPADLARATLWSWTGVQRMIDLSRTVLISPVDLETHFQRSGLFEQGLQQFERAVAKRVEERGAFSAILTKLASLRAPAIFLLEDLAAEVDLQRDQLLRILERLGEAPFHLVDRIDSGEFCLRYPVASSLSQLSEYALSLRERLPDRTRDRVRGIDAEDDESELVPVSRETHAHRSSLAVPLFAEDSTEDR